MLPVNRRTVLSTLAGALVVRGATGPSRKTMRESFGA